MCTDKGNLDKINMTARTFYSVENMSTLRDTITEQTGVHILAGSALFQDAMQTAFEKCVSTGTPGGPMLMLRMNEMVIHLLTRCLAPQMSGRGNHMAMNQKVSIRDMEFASAAFMGNRAIKTAIAQNDAKELLDKITKRMHAKGGLILGASRT